ncbi:MAG: hypothetical protein K2I73_08165 [Eubacterium sp.]|nr:hypothetical protein [Eubacterium sp.]
MNNFEVKFDKKGAIILGTICGIILSILFLTIFGIAFMSFLLNPTGSSLALSIINLLLGLLFVINTCSCSRPKIYVYNGKIIYYPYPIFKSIRFVNTFEIAYKTKSVDKLSVYRSTWSVFAFLMALELSKDNPENYINRVTYYSSDGKKILTFTTNMKNAKLLENYIDSKCPQINEQGHEQ